MNNLVIELDLFELIRVSGTDARHFLQGQVSCNMELLSDEYSLIGAICNIKGRVVSDFRVFADGDDCLLAVSKGIATEVVKLLSKYAVFSKAEVTIDAQNLRHYGLLGDAAYEQIGALFGSCPTTPGELLAKDGGKVICLSKQRPRFDIWLADKSSDHLTLQKNQTGNGQLEGWLAEDIRAGILHVDSDLSAKYTPALLNYDLSGVIDFKKGCYTGQEIIARMHYRGNAKLRMFYAKLESSYAIQPSSVATYCRDDKLKEAEILCYLNQAQSSQLLVLLPADADQSTAVFLIDNQDNLPLKIHPLLYNE
jgi:folate-binding protein YgfZ